VNAKLDVAITGVTIATVIMLCTQRFLSDFVVPPPVKPPVIVLKSPKMGVLWGSPTIFVDED